jgi:hypothetical protein
MVDVAALDGDSAKLRRAGTFYLSRDTAGATAEYVRWLLAVAGDGADTQGAVRAPVGSLSRTTLQQIYLTSQMTGLGLEDADTAAMLLIEEHADPLDRSVALRRAQLLALNRGRPVEATRHIRRREALGSSDHQFRNFALLAALFDDGDRRTADSVARIVDRMLARDTLGPLAPDALRLTSEAMVTQAMWYLMSGDTARAVRATDWLGRQHETGPRNRALYVLPEMMLASRARRPEGASLRAYVDSLALEGCCEVSAFTSLVLARAYEDSGDEVTALRVIRRGQWLFPPRALATHLREEGRLSARAGDRAGAIRAYEHYLALRSDPEPSLRAARDSVRAEVDRLRLR